MHKLPTWIIYGISGTILGLLVVVLVVEMITLRDESILSQELQLAKVNNTSWQSEMGNQLENLTQAVNQDEQQLLQKLNTVAGSEQQTKKLLARFAKLTYKRQYDLAMMIETTQNELKVMLNSNNEENSMTVGNYQLAQGYYIYGVEPYGVVLGMPNGQFIIARIGREIPGLGQVTSISNNAVFVGHWMIGQEST